VARDNLRYIGEKLKEFTSQNFTWNKIGEKYLNLYHYVLKM
jgi:glycosyltransferase involved in cell wall biosynthesis